MDPSISVVIPTLGRHRKLARVLDGFAGLAGGTPPFEVVLALDGEDRETRRMARAQPFPVVAVSQPRSGTGAARNLGARAARHPLVLLLNDDTRPHPDLLWQHARFQQQSGPCLALGRVEWDPEREITPFMRWLAPAGRQFNYDRLTPGGEADWTACWGTNLAIPRGWLLDEPFDPTLRVSAQEDVEFGYRQWKRGHKLRYLPDALCYHHHRYEGPRDYRRRARVAGGAARLVVRRHPQLVVPLLLRPLAAALAEGVGHVAKRARSKEPAVRERMSWELDFRWNYLKGVLDVDRDGAL